MIDKMNQEGGKFFFQIPDAVKTILEQIGEDPSREGLVDTPARVEKMLHEICGGYQEDLKSVVNGAVFHESVDGMVLVRDIEFYSLCEHHLMPFFGKVHVAYIPNGKIIGLSKIPRIVDMYARRLQVQERLTQQIVAAVEEILEPEGTAVMIEAGHLCAMMRGVKKKQARLVTSVFHGIFSSDESLRREFFDRLKSDNK